MRQKNEHIPIARPIFGERERELLLRPLETGWVVQGPYVDRFEKMFAGYCGSPHALATTGCTTALHLILAALGIGPGDEVIVPSFTFVATANAVEHTGARAIFTDVELDTFNLDPNLVEALITLRTRAIMPVSFFGLSADLKAITDLAQGKGIHVIEDAACALGARREGFHAGTKCTAGAFSFHPRKAVTTGEGGMVTTADPELALRIAKLRNHGAEATDLERHQQEGGSRLPAFNMLGYNYRMTDLQGALGVAQMARLPQILEDRKAGAALYDELLAGEGRISRPAAPPGHEHAYQSYVVLYKGQARQPPDLANLPMLNHQRNAIMAAMEAEGISVRQGTHAVHTLGYYAGKYGLRPDGLPNSLMADHLSLALPLFSGLTAAQQERVAACLTQAMDRA